MGRKPNQVKLNTVGFDSWLEELDRVGGDVRGTVEKSLTVASEKIAVDTAKALDKANLPAGGHYSHGDTKKSIITDAKVTWVGSVAEIPVGFDFNLPGAGGFLIAGSPRMKPDVKLNRMYRQKAYMNGVSKMVLEMINEAIAEATTK